MLRSSATSYYQADGRLLQASLAILHRGEGHKVAAAQGVAKQAVAGTVRQPDQPRAGPSKTALNDETAFVSLAKPDTGTLSHSVAREQQMAAKVVTTREKTLNAAKLDEYKKIAPASF
jgi:hypothetical protein